MNAPTKRYLLTHATPLALPPRPRAPRLRKLRNAGDNVARDLASHHLETFNIPLQAAGYRTAFIGKWHMGNSAAPRPGWNYWSALPGQGRAEDPDLSEEGGLRTVRGYTTDLLTDRAVRTARYKYVHWVKFPDQDELYDLRTDSLERRNVAGDPAMARVRAEMRRELGRLVVEAVGIPPR